MEFKENNTQEKRLLESCVILRNLTLAIDGTRFQIVVHSWTPPYMVLSFITVVAVEGMHGMQVVWIVHVTGVCLIKTISYSFYSLQGLLRDRKLF